MRDKRGGKRRTERLVHQDVLPGATWRLHSKTLTSLGKSSWRRNGAWEGRGWRTAEHT